jgi:hypothetical protein
MERYCDFCETKLPGRKGHGFVTAEGRLSCGRSAVQKTINRGGSPSLVSVPLPCGDATKG